MTQIADFFGAQQRTDTDYRFHDAFRLEFYFGREIESKEFPQKANDKMKPCKRMKRFKMHEVKKMFGSRLV